MQMHGVVGPLPLLRLAGIRGNNVAWSGLPKGTGDDRVRSFHSGASKVIEAAILRSVIAACFLVLSHQAVAMELGLSEPAEIVLQTGTEIGVPDEQLLSYLNAIFLGGNCLMVGSSSGNWRPEHADAFRESLSRFMRCHLDDPPDNYEDTARFLAYSYWKALENAGGSDEPEEMATYYLELGRQMLYRRIEALSSHENFPDQSHWTEMMADEKRRLVGLLEERLDVLTTDWLCPAFRRELRDEELAYVWEAGFIESPNEGDYEAARSVAVRRQMGPDEYFETRLRRALETQALNYFVTVFNEAIRYELSDNRCFGLGLWQASGTFDRAFVEDCWPSRVTMYRLPEPYELSLDELRSLTEALETDTEEDGI